MNRFSQIEFRGFAKTLPDDSDSYPAKIKNLSSECGYYLNEFCEYKLPLAFICNE